jgi:hypothetical protein
MRTSIKKLFLRLPSWGLALLAAVFSIVLLSFLADVIGPIWPFDKNIGEVVAYIVYALSIAIACYFICKKDPKSVWYVLILSNIFGILSAIIEPNFWITPLWILICGGWIITIIGALLGAKKGKLENEHISN